MRLTASVFDCFILNCVCTRFADGDGRSELVVGYTDRVVRAFRWEEPTDSSDLSSGQLVLLKKWLLEGQAGLYTNMEYVNQRLKNS